MVNFGGAGVLGDVVVKHFWFFGFRFDSADGNLVKLFVSNDCFRFEFLSDVIDAFV